LLQLEANWFWLH